MTNLNLESIYASCAVTSRIRIRTAHVFILIFVRRSRLRRIASGTYTVGSAKGKRTSTYVQTGATSHLAYRTQGKDKKKKKDEGFKKHITEPF